MITTLVLPAPITNVRVDFLQSKGIDEDISRVDLEMVKMKLSESEEGVGWNSEQSEDAEIEYKRYLTLCKKYPHPKYSIVPNKVMDAFWHYHILDTRAYVKDSEIIFGGYFHHYPYFGMRGEEDFKQLKSSFEKTKQLYESLFGEPMARDGESSCWHDCQNRCWNECSN